MPLWIPPIWMVTWCRDLKKQRKIIKMSSQMMVYKLYKMVYKVTIPAFLLVSSIMPNPSKSLLCPLWKIAVRLDYIQFSLRKGYFRASIKGHKKRPRSYYWPLLTVLTFATRWHPLALCVGDNPSKTLAKPCVLWFSATIQFLVCRPTCLMVKQC